MPEWEEVQGVNMTRQLVMLAVLICGAMALANAQGWAGREIIRLDNSQGPGETVLEDANGAWKLRADNVDFISGEKRLVASGNVVYISDGGCVTADSAEFELVPETGTLLGSGTFHNARVSGSEGCDERVTH